MTGTQFLTTLPVITWIACFLLEIVRCTRCGEPTEIRCTAQNLDSMLCDWCPNEYPNISYTKWKLTYSFNGTDVYNGCPSNPMECQCEFNTVEQYGLKLLDIMNFKIKTKLWCANGREKERNFTMQLSTNLVLPGPVIFVDSVTGSDWIYIDWKEPVGLEKLNTLLYYVNITAVEDQSFNMFFSNLTTTELNITGLTPWTNYTISVTISNGPGGKTSGPNTTLKATQVAAPASGPGSFNGAFYKDNHRGGYWIYWTDPEVPNGPIDYYNITYTTQSGVSVTVQQAPVNSIWLPDTQLGQVQIVAVNVDQYNQSLPSSPSVINIDSGADGPVITMAEIKDSSVTINWTKTAQRVVHFVFIACANSENETQCSNSVEMRIIDAVDEDHWQLTHHQHAVMKMYGLSAVLDRGSSSGFTWIHLCEAAQGILTPPQNVKCYQDGEQTIVNWSSHLCANGEGSVSQYRLYWSATVQSDACDNAWSNVTEIDSWKTEAQISTKHLGSSTHMCLKAMNQVNSRKTEFVCHLPTHKDGGFLILITVPCGFGAVTVIIIFIIIFVKTRKWYNKEVAILIPPPHPPSDSGLAADNYFYNFLPGLMYSSNDIRKEDCTVKFLDDGYLEPIHASGFNYYSCNTKHIPAPLNKEALCMRVMSDEGYSSQANSPTEIITHPYLAMSSNCYISSDQENSAETSHDPLPSVTSNLLESQCTISTVCEDSYSLNNGLRCTTTLSALDGCNVQQVFKHQDSFIDEELQAIGQPMAYVTPSIAAELQNAFENDFKAYHQPPPGSRSCEFLFESSSF